MVLPSRESRFNTVGTIVFNMIAEGCPVLQNPAVFSVTVNGSAQDKAIPNILATQRVLNELRSHPSYQASKVAT